MAARSDALRPSPAPANHSFWYLIAAHNEEAGIETTVDNLTWLPEKFPGSRVYVVENGSQDQTFSLLAKKKELYPEWLKVISIPEKGLGLAFREGLNQMKDDLESLPLDSSLKREIWVVFTAADLPFGFSDLHSFLEIEKQTEAPLHQKARTDLYVGSKSHPQSKTPRSFKRTLGSWVLKILRRGLLGMRTQDPNGTLFLRADLIPRIRGIKSHDYFFTTEVVHLVESISHVREIPVELQPEVRPSKVRLFQDGLKMIYQIIKLRGR